MLKSEAFFDECSLESWRAVIEKEAVSNVVFLWRFTEKLLRQHGRSGRKQPYVEEFVRLEIDRGVQPERSLLS